MSLHVQETFLNATEGYIFGESDVYETDMETPGDLYRALQREYGRCTGKVYVDTSDGVRAIGWVFQKRDRYEDTGTPYIREVWVTVHDAPTTVTRTHHYHYISGSP